MTRREIGVRDGKNVNSEFDFVEKTLQVFMIGIFLLCLHANQILTVNPEIVNNLNWVLVFII